MDEPVKTASDIQILMNVCEMMPLAWNKRTVNWAKVQKILLWRTNHSGSSSSIEKCKQMQIDPWGYGFPQIQKGNENENQT